jgi:hypothetical protein
VPVLFGARIARYGRSGAMVDRYFKEPDRIVESFERNRAPVLEDNRLSYGELTYSTRYENLPGVRVSTDPGCEIHDGTEEVFVLADWFSCANPDANTGVT